VITCGKEDQVTSFERGESRDHIYEKIFSFECKIVKCQSKQNDAKIFPLLLGKVTVRKTNTRFRLSDVHNLAAEFIAGFDEETAEKAILHARKIKDTFRTADHFIEENVEPVLSDDGSDVETDTELKEDE
jgi:hypothetical protein